VSATVVTHGDMSPVIKFGEQVLDSEALLIERGVGAFRSERKRSISRLLSLSRPRPTTFRPG
jgi:hypothetical protein